MPYSRRALARTGATLIVTVNPGDVKEQLGLLRKGFDKVLFEGGTEG